MQNSQTYKKVNSFSMRPSPAQIITYTMIILQACIFYIMIRPNLLYQHTQITLTTLFSASLLSLIITAFICSYIDPSDSVMVRCKNGHTRDYRDKVSELNYCQYCRTYVTVQAKHCRECDRCVQNFDHHCMWINNCVGGKNYSVFISMIVSAFLNLGVYLASVVVISLEQNWKSFMGFIVTIWTVMAIVFIFWFLLFNLNLLHLYLKCKGYTTYQFIVARKQQQRRAQYEKMNKKNKEQNKAKFSIQKKKQDILYKEPKIQDNLDEKVNKINVSTIDKNNESPQKQQKSNMNLIQTDSNIKLQKKQQAEPIQTNIFNIDTTLKQLKHSQSLSINSNKKSKNNNLQDNVNQVDNEDGKTKYIGGDDGNRGEDVDDGNFSRSSSNESVKINRFFMRNKSYTIILGNQQAYSPEKKYAHTSFVLETGNPNPNTINFHTNSNGNIHKNSTKVSYKKRSPINLQSPNKSKSRVNSSIISVVSKQSKQELKKTNQTQTLNKNSNNNK